MSDRDAHFPYFSQHLKAQQDLPDVANEKKLNFEQKADEEASALDWVGMENLELPLLQSSQEAPHPFFIPAAVAVGVSLDVGDQRGIHMSRLYTLLRDRLAGSSITSSQLILLLEELIKSQRGLSQNARLELSFDHWLKHRALLSEEWGWRKYPVKILAQCQEGSASITYIFHVLYSSTCPASGALARHDWVQKLKEEFGSKEWEAEKVTAWIQRETTNLATPHAQRSEAIIELQFKNEPHEPHHKENSHQQNIIEEPLWREWIELAENTLGTPVQTAVRRKDEQEFARLNGKNPMFCEDAARKLLKAFKSLDSLKHLRIKVSHLESLHPHDAVAAIEWKSN